MTSPLRSVRLIQLLQSQNTTICARMNQSRLDKPRHFSLVGGVSCRRHLLTCNNASAHSNSTSNQSQGLLGHFVDPMRGSRKKLFVESVRGMAGHSHWQNIRHAKAAQDKIISHTRMKFGQLIKGAIKLGGADPKSNPKLAKLIAQAEQEDVPKKSIKDMIENAVKSKDMGLLDIEVLGPAGSVFMVQVYAPSQKTAVNIISSVIKKVGGSISSSRLANHVFDHKGVVKVELPEGEGTVDLDRYLEVAIEVGAEDVIAVESQTGQPALQFHCDVKCTNSVQKNLEEEGLTVVSAAPEYIPLSWCTLSGQELATAEAIVKKLYTLPEVEAVFDNVTPPEE